MQDLRDNHKMTETIVNRRLIEQATKDFAVECAPGEDVLYITLQPPGTTWSLGMRECHPFVDKLFEAVTAAA